MKRKFFSAIVILSIITVVVFNIVVNKKNDNVASLLKLENIEALAQGESGNGCPDHNYVPNRYIQSSGPKSVTYQSNSKGEITISGQVFAGYAKNTSVTIQVETFNCDGVQTGACCDQRKVGTYPC